MLKSQSISYANKSPPENEWFLISIQPGMLARLQDSSALVHTSPAHPSNNSRESPKKNRFLFAELVSSKFTGFDAKSTHDRQIFWLQLPYRGKFAGVASS